MHPIDFLQSPARHAWCKFEHLNVYMRHAYHNVGGRLAVCIDIANVDTPERYQRQGGFTRLIEMLMKQGAPGSYLRVENVMTPYLAEHLRKTGWTQTPGLGWGDDTPTFIKEVPERSW